MRRNLVAFLSTLTGLVLLFSYHTSLDSRAPATAATGPLTARRGRAERLVRFVVRVELVVRIELLEADHSERDEDVHRRRRPDPLGPGAGPDHRREGQDHQPLSRRRCPSGNFRDQEINSYAVPILNQEVVQAQSAQIDAVSGATVTSDGYIQSLQSAIDQAHL